MTNPKPDKTDPEEYVHYLNSPAKFHLEMPLYLEIGLENEIIAKQTHKLVSYSGKFDAYCIWCQKESIFRTYRSYSEEYLIHFSRESNFSCEYRCERDSTHSYEIYYKKNSNSFQKIGQYPSVADFQIPQVKKYRKLLDKEKYQELTKGVGLAAHGVGIGSFVYVRRVFESLVEKAHLEASGKIPEDNYSKARMDDKINILKDHLPKFLVENRKLYAILSKGIHELTEKECLKYFGLIKTGIELILDEKIIEKEKQEKIKNVTNELARTHGELNKSNESKTEEIKQEPK